MTKEIHKIKKHITVNILPKGLFSNLLSILAALVSWYFNKSVGWAILHFLLGGWYLFYKLITGAFANQVWFDIINHYIN